LEEALMREAMEEVGFEISTYSSFAYRKINALNTPETRLGRELYYPYPISYIPYFYAHTDKPLVAPTGKEIQDSMVCSIDEIDELLKEGAMNSTEVTIIKHGLKAAKKAVSRK
jgi:8-oxo-dGTP pyrophosphatase MutT (NUDIX family)